MRVIVIKLLPQNNSTQIANGIGTGVSCTPDYPPYLGLAGLFNWNMTADSICNNYDNTINIDNLVHYTG